jgi:hypothetical protein
MALVASGWPMAMSAGAGFEAGMEFQITPGVPRSVTKDAVRRHGDRFSRPA